MGYGLETIMSQSGYLGNFHFVPQYEENILSFFSLSNIEPTYRLLTSSTIKVLFPFWPQEEAPI